MIGDVSVCRVTQGGASRESVELVSWRNCLLNREEKLLKFWKLPSKVEKEVRYESERKKLS